MFIDPVSPRSRIIGTGSYAPARIVQNAELELRGDSHKTWIGERTGILRRRAAAAGERGRARRSDAGRLQRVGERRLERWRRGVRPRSRRGQGENGAERADEGREAQHRPPV